MKRIQNQPALAIAVLGLLLGLSIGKIYQQRLQINQIRHEAAIFPILSAQELIPAMEIPEDLQRHESTLENETERIKEEMARLQTELESVRREHEALLDAHLRQLGRAQ